MHWLDAENLREACEDAPQDMFKRKVLIICFLFFPMYIAQICFHVFIMKPCF
jgi:hypothetical protein